MCMEIREVTSKAAVLIELNRMRDDGVIKFSCEWQFHQPFDCPELESLMLWRDRMFALGFIGVYPDGVGYGNISVRLSDTTFLISGTQTGHIQQTQRSHYTLVDDWSIAQNSLNCRGPVKASSESLTHAALYEFSNDIHAIIHIHEPKLWQACKYKLPTTCATVPYGTPDMAVEMWRLFQEEGLTHHKVLVMAGHEDGLLAFGSTLKDASNVLQAASHFIVSI